MKVGKMCTEKKKKIDEKEKRKQRVTAGNEEMEKEGKNGKKRKGGKNKGTG